MFLFFRSSGNLARFDYTKVRLASPAESTAPLPTGGGTTASSSSGANTQVAVLQQVYFLLMLHSTSSTLYYLNDRLGTPQLLVDQTGHVVWQGEYHPFGRVDTVVNTRVADFRFPGQRLDMETGLHYNAMRYYDPETGRYITTDPIGLAGGMNPYLYTEADPVNWVDPWGLYRSPWYLDWVPGQHLFDTGMTAIENKQYGAAAGYFGGMVAEDVLTALTFGYGSSAQGIARTSNIGCHTAAEGTGSLWAAPSGERQVVNGLEYTNHALERMAPRGLIQKGTEMISRGVPPSVIENAIQYGNIVEGNTANEIVHVYENVRVVTDPASSRVITVITTGR